MSKSKTESKAASESKADGKAQADSGAKGQADAAKAEAKPEMPKGKRFYLVPKEGLKVYREDTHQPIPPEGAWVPNTRYYRRRLQDGDGTQGAPPPKPEATKDTKGSKKGDGK